MIAALPATGVAVQSSSGTVQLLRLDGSVARTLDGWRIAPAAGTPLGSVYLRDRRGRIWRVRHGLVTRVARMPRPRYTRGCFSTAPHTEICGYPYGPQPSRILVDGRVVPGSRRRFGHWLVVDLSRHRRLLAQWTGECAIPTAYVGDVRYIRAAFYPTIESVALGWVGDTPVYAFPVGGCGEWYDRPGIYVGHERIRGVRPGDVVALWR